MEVKLSPELQAKLESIAAQQGRDSASLVHEAVERLIGYDEWFMRKVEEGLAQIDAEKRLNTTKLPLGWKGSSPKNNAAANASPLDHGCGEPAGWFQYAST
jgi:predicted transcriptional regulator